MENSIQNNNINLSGQITSEFTYSHQAYGEAFYNFMLTSKRLSDAYDVLPVTISERLLIDIDAKTGQFVTISGQLRTYNSYYDNKNHLILTVFAKDIEINEEKNKDINHIELNGFICKTPIYRTTPFGREIADILLAVNRAYNKSDYIPIICWGRNAKFASNLDIGSNISITGRMQSRNYQKKLSETESVEKIAYEVSVSQIESKNATEIASDLDLNINNN